MATRWRWPPESCDGRRSSRCDRSRIAAASDLFLDLLVRTPGDLQRKAHVFADRHMRIERIGLEDHRDVAGARRQVVDDIVADLDRAAADIFEAGDHPQRRRFSAAGRADQSDELAVLRLQGRCRAPLPARRSA
jgi:hypothetical protein